MNNDNQRLLYFMGRLIKPEMKEPYIKDYNDSLAWKSDTEKYNGHLNFLWETGIPVSEYWKAIWKYGSWKIEGVDFLFIYEYGILIGTPNEQWVEIPYKSIKHHKETRVTALPLPEQKESIPVQGTVSAEGMLIKSFNTEGWDKHEKRMNNFSYYNMIDFAEEYHNLKSTITPPQETVSERSGERLEQIKLLRKEGKTQIITRAKRVYPEKLDQSQQTDENAERREAYIFGASQWLDMAFNEWEATLLEPLSTPISDERGKEDLGAGASNSD
jgi:hypothetical protein